MKKSLDKLSMCVGLAVVLLCMTGCVPDVLYGSITKLKAEAGDGISIVSWEDKVYNNAKISVGYENKNDLSDSYETVLSSDPHWVKFDNLKNDETYRVYVSVVTSSGKVKNIKEDLVTPSASFNRQIVSYDSVTGENSFVKLDRNNFAVSLENVKGKFISYAVYNKNESNPLTYDKIRKFAGKASFQSGYSASASRSAVAESELPLTGHFVAPAPEKTRASEVVSRAALSGLNEAETFNKEAPEIGQTKDIYVDTDLTNVTFQKERMTLYAICYVPGTTKIKALIWANPENVVETGSSETKISIPAIHDLAKKYIQFYKLEESVFGETGDYIIAKDKSGWQAVLADISNYPTKDYINIVLTDIEKDYYKGRNSIIGGYFWQKDYYEKNFPGTTGYAPQYTNEGKYFYIDIPYCNQNTERKDYKGNNDKVCDFAISTLFHEYQHMIHFNQKFNVYDPEDKEHWFNEMMSLLCEDLVQDAMNLEETVQMMRITNFNPYYYISGIAHYRFDEYSFLSYATSYAFGSWLARNYGGAALVEEMSKNDKLGLASVLAAIKTVTGKDIAQQDLIDEYLQAVVFRNAYALKHNLPSHNVLPADGVLLPQYNVKRDIDVPEIKIIVSDAVDCSRYSEKSLAENTFTAKLASGINLWSSTYKTVYNSLYTFYGPIFFSPENEIDVMQTGFVLYGITNECKEDNVTLYFTDSFTDDDEIYIYIQDSVNSSTPHYYEDKTAEVTY